MESSGAGLLPFSMFSCCCLRCGLWLVGLGEKGSVLVEGEEGGEGNVF